jgi:hypothetical protein
MSDKIDKNQTSFTENAVDFFRQQNWTWKRALAYTIIALLLFPLSRLAQYITLPTFFYIQHTMPRTYLLLLLAISCFFTLVFTVIFVFFYLNNQSLKKQIKSLNKKLPHMFSMNLIWDNHNNPYCPSDLALMHPYPFEEAKSCIKLQCYKCKQIIPIIHNTQGISYTLRDAIHYLIQNKYPTKSLEEKFGDLDESETSSPSSLE